MDRQVRRCRSGREARGKAGENCARRRVAHEATDLLAVIERWRKDDAARWRTHCSMDEGIDQKTPATLIGDCSQTFLAAKKGSRKPKR